jgi:hypothetical protein
MDSSEGRITKIITYVNTVALIAILIYCEKRISSVATLTESTKTETNAEIGRMHKLISEISSAVKDMEQRQKLDIENQRDIRRKNMKAREKEIRRLEELEFKVNQIMQAMGDKLPQALPPPPPPVHQHYRHQVSDSDSDIGEAVKEVTRSRRSMRN